MNDRRTISVPCVAYNRAKAHAKAIRASLSGFVSKLITEDLAAAGVSEDDPGTPTLPRFRSETAQGPRTSFSLTGLLYRRTRVHAASIKTPLWIYVVRLVEADLALAGVADGDPGPQPRGRGGRPPGRSTSPSPLVSPCAVALTPTQANPSLSPSPAPKDPALLAADEARCAEALATAGMSSAGTFLL